jgi:hypothetical protein
MANGMPYPGVYRNEIDNSFVSQTNNSSYATVLGRASKGLPNAKILVHNESELVNTFGPPIVSGSFPLVSAIDYGIYAGIAALNETSNLWYVRLTDGSERYASITVPTNSASATSGLASVLSAAPSTSYPNLAGYPEGNTPEDNYDLRVFNGIPSGLRFSSIGPGIAGNNLAVSIVTTAVSGTSLSALNDWSNKYDDASISANKKSDKIFKILVYTKQSNQSFDTAWWSSVSGAPIEIFYASTDFTLLDNGGNSIYVEDVINGKSQYIYVTSNKTDGTLPAYTTSGLGFSGGSVPGTLSTLSASTVWSLFENKETASLNTAIIIPRSQDAYSDPTEVAAVDALVGRRKDFVGFTQATSLTAINLTTIKSDSAFVVVGSNPSYFGKYVGWNLVLDRYNSSRVYLPNCIYGAAVSLRTDRIASPWDAPAGIDRGLIASGKQNVNLTPAVAGPLYEQYNLNTVKYINGFGNVIWGQKTAQLKTTARDRLNVRKMLITVENNIESILNGFIFQGNTVKARERVSSLVNSYLQTVQAGGGVQSYRVVCNSTNNTSTTIAQNILNVDIYIQPTYTIEFVKLNTIISADSVSVSEG